MGRPSAHEIIRQLDLKPLPEEGGFYHVTWASSNGSAIYFLLTSDSLGFSAFHVLGTDEIYHFYLGDAAELHLLHPDRSHQRIVLGPDLEMGQRPQIVVPAGSAQASRVVSGGEYSLVGTTMAPPFSAQGFHLSSRAELLSRFPDQGKIITALTRG